MQGLDISVEGAHQGCLPIFGGHQGKASLLLHHETHWPSENRFVFVENSTNRRFQEGVESTDHDIEESTAVVALLNVCVKQKDLLKGNRLHADIVKNGWLEKDISVGNTLLSMYAKCGALVKAKEVCEKLPERDVISWNALITGYIQHGHSAAALDFFRMMKDEGICPNAVTFASILKACGSLGEAEKGKEIHEEVVMQGLLKRDLVLGNALVDMYAKCAILSKAQEVFDKLPTRDVVSWTALITGYSQHGHGIEALEAYRKMQDEGLSPNKITLASILKACSISGSVERGKEMHSEIARQGMLAKDIVLGNALVDMYAKCGALAEAQELFDELPVRNVVTWSALIAGYAQHGYDYEALKCFDQMQSEGIFPVRGIFVSILKSCASITALKKGEQIHSEVSNQGLLGKDIALGTALIDMYVKCGAFAKALEVFNELPERDVVSWSVLIAGYVQNGQSAEALNCFSRMRDEGFHPDSVTFLCLLKACGSLGAGDKGKELHAEIASQGLLIKDIVLGNALMDMYNQLGNLTKAQEIFEELLVTDVASWNVLIGGYTEHGHCNAALKCFGQMREEGLSPNTGTFVCILKVCGSIGAVEKGKEIHAQTTRECLLEQDIMIGTALVDMYAKCGVLVKAQQVFDELPFRNTITWGALLAGYAELALVQTMFDSFKKMVGEQIVPDKVIFSILLVACSHAGLVDEGQFFFENMATLYSTIPALKHHTSMVDLFGRAGHFDKAVTMIENVAPNDSLHLWCSLLGACRKWANSEFGRRAFEHVIELDKKNVETYVCMSNMYAAIGMPNEVDKELTRKEVGD